MLQFLKNLIRKTNKPIHQPPAPLRAIIIDGCLDAMRESMAREIDGQHEGVVYLLGRTDGKTTIIMTVIRPESKTTSGSFQVGSTSMAKVVRAATNIGLQVVGQAHTHPGVAFHSHEDDIGARIRYEGYVSIVFPNFGRDLPQIRGSAIYMFQPTKGFEALKINQVNIVPTRII